MPTNPNPCPLCQHTPKSWGDGFVRCYGETCILNGLEFTAAEWAMLTAGPAQRARAEKAIEALRDIAARIERWLDGNCSSIPTNLIACIRDVARKALEDLDR